jgi:hypothetical protein
VPDCASGLFSDWAVVPSFAVYCWQDTGFYCSFFAHFCVDFCLDVMVAFYFVFDSALPACSGFAYPGDADAWQTNGLGIFWHSHFA